MKIRNAVFFAAIMGLTISFSACNKNKQLTVTEIEVPKGPNDIAYVDMDSLNAHCELFKILKEDLEKETAQKKAILGNKQKALETKFMNYQQNMQSGTLTQLQVQNAEKTLAQERDELMTLSEQYASDLEAKQAAIMLQVYDSIQVSVKRVNDNTFKAKFVLSYQYGSGVLLADKNYDMTQAVLEDLNKYYKK